jgi:hypothetical protein
VNVLSLSDKVKILDLLRGGMSSSKLGSIVGKMNQALANSMHPKYACFFPQQHFLGTIYPQIARFY